MIPRSLNLASFEDSDQFERMFRETDIRTDGRGNVFCFSYGESGALSDVRLFETSDNYSESEEL